MGKKRILFINGHLNVGGVERSLVDILRNIDYDDYDVTLLLLEGLGDYFEELPASLNVKLIDLHNTYGNFYACIFRCICKKDSVCLRMRLLMTAAKVFGSPVYALARRMLFGTQKYDCVIGFRPGICTDLASFAVNAKKRFTWWHHGAYLMGGQAEKNYYKDCLKMDGIITVSQFCQSLLSEKIPEQESKITIIPNMVDPETILAKANESIPYKKDGTIHIVSIGGLYKGKHFEDIIPAAQKLINSGLEHFIWYLIGDGPERTSLLSLKKKNNLSDHILMVGKKQNPYPWIKNADLFVHPSHIESQGLVVLEALALGIPCVVANSPGPSEFIKNGFNGLLTDHSPEDLADKVTMILSNTELYMSIKENTFCPVSFLPSTVIDLVEKNCF